MVAEHEVAQSGPLSTARSQGSGLAERGWLGSSMCAAVGATGHACNQQPHRCSCLLALLLCGWVWSQWRALWRPPRKFHFCAAVAVAMARGRLISLAVLWLRVLLTTPCYTAPCTRAPPQRV